jgi:hypothetical protein
MVDQIVVAVVTTALTIITAVCTTIIIPRVGAWLDSKTHTQLLLTAVDELTKAAEITVNQLNQTVVNQLKADGKFDPIAQKQVLDTAVKQIESNLTKGTVDFLTKNGADITAMIISYIESHIATTKPSATSAA